MVVEQVDCSGKQTGSSYRCYNHHSYDGDTRFTSDHESSDRTYDVETSSVVVLTSDDFT